MLQETDFLCDLTHSYISGKKSQPVPAHLLWEDLQELLEQHGVLTTLAANLGQHKLSAEASQSVASVNRNADRRNAVMLLELSRFLPQLEESGCRPIVLKGAGLVQTVYKSIEQRIFADLDILVPLDKVELAQTIMESFGYINNEFYASIQFYAQHHFHQLMRSPGGITVEIHWSLTTPNSCYQFNLERFSSRTHILETINGPIRMPHWNDQLLHCIIQNIADGFSGLRRVIDAALILPMIEDCELLVAEAREQNLASGLWAVMYLVREMTDTPGADQLMQLIAPPASLIRCFESIDLPQICLKQEALKDQGLYNLLHWLCTPDLTTAYKEIWRYMLPRSEDYVYYGYAQGDKPPLHYRIKESIQHTFLVAKIFSHLGLKTLARRNNRN